MILAFDKLKIASASGTIFFFSVFEKCRIWLRSLRAISFPIYSLDPKSASPRMAV